MLRHVYILIILGHSAFSQDASEITHDQKNQTYDAGVVSKWTNGDSFYDPESKSHCEEECTRTCVNSCPDPNKCDELEIKCGEKDHPEDVWPDCVKDDICIPYNCACRYPICIKTIEILSHVTCFDPSFILLG